VGLRQLKIAAETLSLEIDVRWHPFELNPQMPDAGQNLQEHICEKYGITPQQSNENRLRLTTIGAELGFTFKFDEHSRMVNTFQAHQLLHWANLNGQKHALKLALFAAYFTEQLDVNDLEVLLTAAESVGLDREEAKTVLSDGRHREAVRSEQEKWTSRGITGVPAMVFNEKYLMTGAQGIENYSQVMTKIVAELNITGLKHHIQN